MFRQIIFLLGMVLVILAVGTLVLYLRPSSTATIHLMDGRQIEGEVTKKDKYVIIKPNNGEEQIFTWEQVNYLIGNEPIYNKRLDDITDLLELIAKLGILAAAGVFLIGLYQFDVGQKWRREEFLAQMIKDFGSSSNVENAKQMIEILRFYTQGRTIRLYPERESSGDIFVTVDQIGKALNTVPNEINGDEMRIRECFDAFFSRFERFEHYIESKLVTSESVYIYLGYWINILLNKEIIKGKESKLSEEHLHWLLNYLVEYEFPKASSLLDRYNKKRRYWNLMEN
jgi:hypothetical protein